MLICRPPIDDGADDPNNLAPVVSGAVALLLQSHPDWTPNQVKGKQACAGPLKVLEANHTNDIAPVIANQGLTPNPLVDGTTGAIDDSRSSWSRSSWSSTDSSGIETTRSS